MKSFTEKFKDFVTGRFCSPAAECGEDTATAAIKLSTWLMKTALLNDLLFILVSKIRQKVART